MIKCLNDFVKNPDKRSGLFCRPLGRPVFIHNVAFTLESQNAGSIWGLHVQIPLVIHHCVKYEYPGFQRPVNHIFGFWSLTFI